MNKYLLLTIACLLSALLSDAQDNRPTVIRDVTLIDGSGGAARQHISLLINGDTIADILTADQRVPANAHIVDQAGKTVMPLLVNGHGHLGLIKGNTAAAENYTSANVERQLQRYLEYGTGTVLSMGTDQPLIFPLRDSSSKGLIAGATVYTAGYGFGAAGGVPPAAFGNYINRPETQETAIAAMEKLAALHPDFVKIWVDGGVDKPRVTPEIYNAIIQEAHQHHIKVAAHVYYLEDARRLVAAGIDLLAHSVRDTVMDDAFINEMKAHHVAYIPTLSLDDYSVAYAERPEWMDSTFFKNSLEMGVWEMLNSEIYRSQQQNDKDRTRKLKGFVVAKENLRKLDSAGILICMGTDSGAQPVRAQGFSEHLEMQLMVEAGLSPEKVIHCATANGATLLGIIDKVGILEKGKKADFMILNENPLDNIKATRTISGVWKNGKVI